MKLWNAATPLAILCGACGGGDDVEFVFSVSVYNPDSLYEVTVDTGTVTMESADFHRVDVSYPSYAEGRNALGAQVFVRDGGAIVSEIVLEVADCGDICADRECSELGPIVGQLRALSIDEDGVISRTPLSCITCEGSGGTAVMACP